MSYLAGPIMRRARTFTPVTPEMAMKTTYTSDYALGKKMTSTSPGHAYTYYNPARNGVYQRYSTQDWNLSNHANYVTSDKEKAYAEQIQAAAFRTVKETEAKTNYRQKTVTKKLGERVTDISFWKSELGNELNAMMTEIKTLKEKYRILERAYKDSGNPLRIAEDCLMHREKRQGIDLVHDDVEKLLTKEVEIIKKCQQKMKELLNKVHAQIRMNRACQNTIEIDAGDKNHAQNVDDRMHQLRNNSAGIAYFSGIENFDNTLTIPYSWAKHTRTNINRSLKERAASERLRGDIDHCLRACANDMWSQFTAVNNALHSRLRETTDARNRLQCHLQRTIKGMFDMDNNIQLLRRAIQDKEGPMKVAQTRLDERSRRINVELCKDPVMIQLQREVHEIRNSVKVLQERLKDSELSLARLAKTKSSLENDISVKENSLLIDGKFCLGMRKCFPMEHGMAAVVGMSID